MEEQPDLRLIAFDLEIARPFRETKRFEKLDYGITCAQLYGDDGRVKYVWSADEDKAQLTKDQCVGIVEVMEKLVDDGWTIITHNGLSFDFRVLAEESGLRDRCARLAFFHVDTMFIVTRIRGHFIGLDKIAIGMGVVPKRRSATLSDGTEITEMSGAMAPELWERGERSAVLHYLEGDCVTTLAVGDEVQNSGRLTYRMKKGNDWIDLHLLPTVMDALQMVRNKARWVRFAHPYTRMLEWSMVSLWFAHHGETKYRVPGLDEKDAVAYLTDYLMLDGAEAAAAEETVEQRWKNEGPPPEVVEDEVAF